MIGESESGARRRLLDNDIVIEGVAEIRSGRYATGAVVAQEPPPSGSGDTVSLLVNRGERGQTYVMPDLIGVGGDSAADILRTRGIPRERRRRPSLSRRAVRRDPAAGPRRGLPDRPGRGDLARGQPLTMTPRTLRIAPSILAADFAALGAAVSDGGGGRRRPDSRGRDGRALRAQPDDRNPGRRRARPRGERCRSTCT